MLIVVTFSNGQEKEQERDLESAELVEYGEEIRGCWFGDPNKLHREWSKDAISD